MPAQSERLASVEQSLEVARGIASAAFETSPIQAAEIFPEDEQDKRLQVLAHKLIEYAVQAESVGKEIAGTQTVADALTELAPSNFNNGSRRQRKARLALNEWFDLEYSGRRVIGASLMSVIDHHEKRTLQLSGELRNKYLGNETDAPRHLFTTSEGFEFFQLETKAHLQQESAVTGHCVGTSSWHSERLAKGKDYYFSLRNLGAPNDDPFKHTTFQYDVEREAITQMRGLRNKGVGLDSPHLLSIVEAIAYLRDEIVHVDPSEFSVNDFMQGTITDVNFDALSGIDIEAMRKIGAIRAIKIPLKIRIDEAFDPLVLDDMPEVLEHCDIREFVFDSKDSEVLARLLEKIGRISGDVTFPQLEVAHGLESIVRIEGHANFPALISSEGLNTLREIDKDANFPALLDASGLSALRKIGGNANFGSLVSARGLGGLERLEGSAVFPALETSKGFDSLREVVGDVRFPVLTDALGLTALEEIGGRAYFGALETSSGLSSLRKIGKGAHFMALKEAYDLTALEYIGARAHFEALETAVGLENLTFIGGRAYLDNLSTSEGLGNVAYIGSYVYANSMDETERRQLRKLIQPKRKRRR